MTDKSVKLILPSQIALHDLLISLEYDTPGIMTFQILIQDSDNLSDGEPGVRTVKQEELEGSLPNTWKRRLGDVSTDVVPVTRRSRRATAVDRS
ncbi:hypothetical protein SCLCIDRAFT_20096 [Scleroderma citrinum Foug A]|uniref:Uncharacterized protein n=1 Tax=Scleroderma citrinum Foug A TaxID=1036808 RepID=A0A0C3E7K7_9AGAM|nr:hypothetical protein SCLCIDRAFT_20096 [Scleroderma citrinum Foug A]